MHTMIANTLPPAQALLVLLGFVGLIGLLFLVVKLVSLKMSGWQMIAQRFPMRDVTFTGDSFKKQDGVVGDIGSGKRGFFDIRLGIQSHAQTPAEPDDSGSSPAKRPLVNDLLPTVPKRQNLPGRSCRETPASYAVSIPANVGHD